MKDYNYSESDIQKYILEELTQEEMLQFETAMKESPEFALEVNRQQKIADGITHFGAQKFKARVKDIYAEVRPEIISKSKSKKSNRSIYKIIFAALVMVLLSFFLYQYIVKSTKTTPQEIYAQNYKTFDWSPSLRSDEPTINLDRAVDLYSSKSFAEAIPLIEGFLKEHPNDIPARLAIANSYLENDNSEFAIPHLRHILTLDDILYQDQANWYLGLVYLKMDKLNDARKIFTLLAADSNADHHLEAKEILKKLD